MTDLSNLRPYSAKAKAKAALERQAAKLPEAVEVIGVDFQADADKKWYGSITLEIPSDMEVPAILEIMDGFYCTFQQPAPVEKAADDDDETDEAPKTKPRGPRETSTAMGPCALVWLTADAMPEAKRKEVIEACRSKGVAFYTARTQYQKWKKARAAGDLSIPGSKDDEEELPAEE